MVKRTYIKKPIIIVAEEYETGMEDGYKEDEFNKNKMVPFINTGNGARTINIGDMIIKQPNGYRFPLSRNMFDEVYREITLEPSKTDKEAWLISEP